MKRFEHRRGDQLLAFGETQAALFENAAVGVFDVTYDVRSIPPRYSRPLVAPGDTPEDLLVGWLHELLALSLRDQLALSYFVVDRLEEGGIWWCWVQGSAAGMPVDEVIVRGPAVEGLDRRTVSIVEIPDGFWVLLKLHLSGSTPLSTPL